MQSPPEALLTVTANAPGRSGTAVKFAQIKRTRGGFLQVEPPRVKNPTRRGKLCASSPGAPANPPFRHAPVHLIGAFVKNYFLGGITASLKAFATRNFTTVFAGILIEAPVWGFRPMRALR